MGPIGIRRLESVEFFVRDLERSRALHAGLLDCAETGGSGPALEARTGERSAVFRAGGCVLVATAPRADDSRSARFLARHPEGVGTLVFEVEDANVALRHLDARGGNPVDDVREAEAGGGRLRWCELATPFGDTRFRFVERRGTTDPFAGHEALAVPRGGRNGLGLTALDHVTANFATMSPALLWMEHVLGFRRFWEVSFHTQDVAGPQDHGSGLRSVVMWDEASGVKLANNEPWRPFFAASQIQLFVDDHRGDGVQHVALAVEDLPAAVRALRRRGARFLPTPGAYYDLLPARLERQSIGRLDEDHALLRELEILVDGEGPGRYLLQIFLEDAATRHGERAAGPFFFELIQRKGDRGFGAGNFRALFESLERQQQSQGAALMLDRMVAGEVPPKHHVALRDGAGRLLYEECLTREGFDGPYTILYHRGRPHAQRRIEVAPGPAPPAAAPALPLARRHFRTPALAATGDTPLDARVPLLFNEDVVLSVARPGAPDPVYVADADGDELYFIRQGGGTVRSVLGDLRFGPDDYVFVPRGLVHRMLPDEGVAQDWLVLEFTGGLHLPRQYRNEAGQLRMDAPYCHRDFRRPDFTGPVDEGRRDLVVRRDGIRHGFRFEHPPLDVVGWDGSVYPFVFPIRRFQPRVGQVHLPPTVHATFAARGALICSFVPRPLDFHPQAVPCPYPHTSVDCDEVLYYVDGSFTSRRGVAAGSLSHHPAGLAHGPHPGAYEDSPGTRETRELAVMMDTTRPLRATSPALSIEDPGYHESC